MAEAAVAETTKKPYRFLGNVRDSLARDHELKKLKKLIVHNRAVMQGHQDTNVAAGSLVFQKLYSETMAAVSTYCARWNVQQIDIEAEYPALNLMRLQARPVAAGSGNSSKALGIVLAFILSPAIVGVAYCIYHWTVKLLHGG